jgi:hypothetical protein
MRIAVQVYCGGLLWRVCGFADQRHCQVIVQEIQTAAATARLRGRVCGAIHLGKKSVILTEMSGIRRLPRTDRTDRRSSG